EQERLRQWAPVAFVYLLWVAIFSIAQMLLTNTVEEKGNRIMEVLLSSVSPLQLMVGKILGIALTGLAMVGSWVLFFFVAVRFLPLVVDVEMEVDLSAIATDPFYLVSFVAYFLLGYLFYAGLLVAIGSVCNSLKEAQNLQSPIMILLFVPLMAMVPIAQDPNGALAKILSFVPPFTPFAMMNRAAGPPATWEYLATTLLLLASVVLVMWAAAKVFRIGILMTGKPPRVGEILRWVRAPVAGVPERKEP
ncbi:MAG: ABC transporter permease, partial [Holophagales bacterium]|nr:ABC transporter permease [Holophagales bacterium]